MNIRYRLEDRTTGEVKTVILSLEEVEAGHASLANNRILSRDIGTGLKDKTGKLELFEHDKAVNAEGETGIIVFTNGGFWLKYLPPHDWNPMCPAEGISRSREYKIIGRE